MQLTSAGVCAAETPAEVSDRVIAGLCTLGGYWMQSIRYARILRVVERSLVAGGEMRVG